MQLIKLNKTEVIPATIKLNFPEIKARLQVELDEIDVTCDTEQQAKDVRAKLNKLIESINDEKKQVKKKLEAPYKDFENQVKELVELVESKSKEFDKIAKEKETIRREAKRQFCKSWWGNDGTYDDVHQDYWLNVATSEKRIKEDMFKAMQGKVEDDLPFTRSVLDVFEPAGCVFNVSVPSTQADNFREYLKIKHYAYSEE
jgi:phage-related tail protein